MLNLEALKQKQKATKNKIQELKELVKDIGSNSKIDFLQQLFNNSQKMTKIDGLLKQLETTDITISVVAEVSQGKSTFLNALIFRDNVLDNGRGAVTARLFKIEYGKKYSINYGNRIEYFLSIDKLKTAIKKLNTDAREEINTNNELKINHNDIIITLPDERLKQGITLYDTPGFGALDEAIIYKYIEKAVSKSDATILLIDISKGLKKNEIHFIKDVMQSIEADKRYVVFNRYDEMISEDQKALMSDQEIADEILNIEKEAKEKLSKLSEVNKDEIHTYMLSSLRALVGHMKEDKQKLKESKFEEFENDLWKRVITSKKTIYQNRISEATKLIVTIEKEILNSKIELTANKTQLEELTYNLDKKITEFKLFTKEAETQLKIISNDSNKKQKKAFDRTKLMEEIKEIINGSIFESLEEVGVLDKAKFWSLKDTYMQKVEEALTDSMILIKPGLEYYVDNSEKVILEIQTDINQVINSINKTLKNYESNNIHTLAEIDLVTKNNGYIEFNSDSKLYDDIDLDKEVFVLLGGILGEIAITRFTAFIPGVGLAISAAIMAGMAIYKKYNNPNIELAKDITEAIMKEFEPKINEILLISDEFGKIFEEKISISIGAYQSNMNAIGKSLENSENKEQEIIKLNQQLDELDSYLNQLKKIKK